MNGMEANPNAIGVITVESNASPKSK